MLTAQNIPLSDKGFAATVDDFVADRQGNLFVSGSQALPTPLVVTKDGGRSWKAVPFVPGTVGIEPPFRYEPRQLVVDPENAEILYDCGLKGIFRSNDGGKLWYLQRAGECAAIAVDRGAHNVILAVVAGGRVIRSVDAGSSWKEVAVLGGPATALVPDPVGFGYVASLNTAGDLYVSADRGVSWQKSPAKFSAAGAAFHPHKSGALYAWNSQALYRSNDLINWAQLPLPAGVNSLDSAYPDPREPGVLWLASYAAGLFRTSNDGITWTLVRAGGHAWVTNCEALVAGGTVQGDAVVSVNGGKDWTSIPFALGRPAFGGGCAGYSLLAPKGAPLFRMYDRLGDPKWQREDSYGGVLAPLREGVLRAVTAGKMRRYGLDGAMQQEYGGTAAIIANRVAGGTDGSAAIGGSEITMGGAKWVAKYGADGKQLYARQGVLLALDPLNRLVMVGEEGVQVINDLGLVELRPSYDPGVLAVRYLSNGDAIVVAWRREGPAGRLSIARFAGETPAWSSVVMAEFDAPKDLVRIQTDAAEQRLWIEFPARAETRNPFVRQLAAGGRTFLQLQAETGRLDWSTALPGKKFVAAGSGDALSIIGVTNYAASIEALTPPVTVAAHGIDVVLNGDRTALGVAVPGQLLTLKGRALWAGTGIPVVRVNGIPARVVMGALTEIGFEVPAGLKGVTAVIELETDASKIEPVEIPAEGA